MVKNNGWACDGRTAFGMKCFGGITGFHQTNGIECYSCRACDFDLCRSCVKFSVWATNLVNEASASDKSWNGSYSYQGNVTQMSFTALIVKDGAVLGNGTDEVGDFNIVGHYNLTKVKFIKKYHGKHTVEYRGLFDGPNKIQGKWSIGGTSDDFTLEKTA